MAKRKSAATQWVEDEVDDLIDAYGGTRAEQVQFVHDLLGEGQYEELTAVEAKRRLDAVRKLAAEEKIKLD